MSQVSVRSSSFHNDPGSFVAVRAPATSLLSPTHQERGTRGHRLRHTLDQGFVVIFHSGWLSR